MLLALDAPLAAASAAPQARLELSTSPPLTELIPDQDELELTIQLRDPAGAPIPRAELHLELTAPPANAFFSTDFPHVEGSRLVSADALAVGGQFSMRIVAPIRGAYRLQVTAKPPAGDRSFAPTTAEWHPVVPENPKKIRNLALFLAGLALVGACSGFVAGRTRTRPRARTAASPAAAAALALIAFAAASISDAALAHGPEGAHRSRVTDPASSATTAASNSKIAKLELRLLTPSPRVGQLAELAATAHDASGAAVPARFQLRFRQLEHDVEVFSTELIAPDGRLAWKGQFFDGSPHRVELIATPLAAADGGPVTAVLETEVEAIAPPLSASAKAFVLLMAVAAAAMACGFWLGGLSQRKAEGRA
jgi:hypothetical protein